MKQFFIIKMVCSALLFCLAGESEAQYSGGTGKGDVMGNMQHQYFGGGGRGDNVGISPLVNIGGCITPTPSLTVSENKGLVSGDGVICFGDAATLAAAGGVSYSWSSGGSTESIIVSPDESSTYTVTVTGVGGCTASASVTVTVKPLPTASIIVDENSGPAANDGVVCPSGTAFISVSGGSTYYWYNGETTATIAVTPGVTTNYTVSVTNSDGCISISSATVNVQDLPPTASCKNITVALNSSGTVSVTGDELNDASSDDCTGTQSLIYSPAQINYTCSDLGVKVVTLTVTDTHGNSATCTSAVTINSGGAQLSATGSIGPGQTICSGQVPTALSGDFTASGSGNITYQWQYSTDGMTFLPVSGAIDQAGYAPEAQTGDIWYRLRASNSGSGDSGSCSVTSNVVFVKVNDVTFSGSIGTDQTVCMGETPEVLASIFPATGDGVISYKWQSSNDGSLYSDITNETSEMYAPGAVTMPVWYRRIPVSTLNTVVCYGLPTTPPVSIGLNNIIAGSITGTQTTCTGSQAMFDELTPVIADGAVTYEWQYSSDNGSSWVSIQSSNAGSYTSWGLSMATYFRRKDISTLNGTMCSAFTNHIGVTTLPPNTGGIWYVDESAGNDLGSGTSDCPKKTIQAAIDAATAGDLIEVAAGYYSEGIIINKQLDIHGEGSNTVISNVSGNAIVYTALASGTSTSIRAKLRDLKISGSSKGIYTDQSVSYLTMEGVIFESNSGYAIHVNNGAGVITDWKIINCDFDNNGSGLYCSSASRMSDLTISGSVFNSQSSSAIYVAQSSTSPGLWNDVTISGNSFTGNGNSAGNAALYIEKMSAGIISNNIMMNNGTDDAPRGVNLNLKYGSYSNITINDNQISDTRIAALAGGFGISVQARNDAPDYDLIPGELTGLIMSDNDVAGFHGGIAVCNAVDWSNATVSGNSIGDCIYGIGGIIYGSGNTANSGKILLVNENSIIGSTYSVINGNSNGGVINAECNWHGTANGVEINNKIQDDYGLVDVSPWLVDGTDTDVTSAGFQSSTGVCTGTPLVIVKTAQTDVICPGIASGSVNLSVTGGTGGYTYDWSDDGSENPDNDNRDRSDLAPGTYSLTVTDGVGATSIFQVTINGPVIPLSLSTTQSDVVCFGELSGSVDLTESGGTGPYTYDWSNDGPENPDNDMQDLTGLPAGTYTVTVTDANGCTVTGSVSILQPADWQVMVSATENSGLTSNDGVICPGSTVTLSASGGTAYLWSNGSTAATIDVLPVTTTSYTVVATNIAGCSRSTTSSVTVGSLPLASILTTENSGTSNDGIICNGVSVSMVASGGASYLWSNGSSSAALVVTPSNNTIYTVTVTGVTACSSTASSSLTVINAPAVSGIMPATGSIGTVLTITGSNLTSVSNVLLNGVNCPVYSINSSNQISVTMPFSGSIQDVNLNSVCGSASYSIQLPSITSFSPSAGPPGTPVSVNGVNLSGTQSVTIGGVPQIILSSSATSLVIFLMPGTSAGQISVTTNSGNAISSGIFGVQPTPVPAIQQGSKLVGSGSGITAQQGTSVAVSADGNTAVVGAPSDNSNMGAAWIFVRNGLIWSQQGGKLTGTGAVGAAKQGISVAISADGNTVAVGGSLDNTSKGAVWVYNRSGTTWTQQGSKLVGAGAVGNAQQGSSVSISADGNIVAIGGLADNTYAGATWIFTRVGGVWSQQGNKLVGTGMVGKARQGCSVALSSDGSNLVVGGYNDNNRRGSCWIFIRNGNTWSQQGSKLIGSGGSTDAYQGWSVAISANGNTVMSGGPGDNSLRGAAWAFTRSGGVWYQQGGKIVGTLFSGASRQGSAVSLSADGNTAIIGGATDNANKGAMWTCKRTGTTWNQQGQKLTGSGASGSAKQSTSLALSSTGTTAFIGGPSDAANRGAAWVYIPNTQLIPLFSDFRNEHNECEFNTFMLHQNTPNPFTGQTSIGFTLPEPCTAEWQITDMSGRVVHLLKREYSAGGNSEIFELKGYSGVYWYTVKTPFGVLTRKMIIVE